MLRWLVVVTVLITVTALLVTQQPAHAKSFKGMVLQISAYSISVQHDPDDIKIFQIRAETKRPPDIVAQDIVKVSYRDENGILIAEKIEVKRKAGE